MTRILALAAALALSGCATPKIIKVGGITHHIDTVNDRPPWCGRRFNEGCFERRSDGGHIWYSEVDPGYVVKHELGHDSGMHHGAWRKHWAYGWCARVTVPAPGYPLGSEICNNGKREIVLEGI